MNRTEQRANPAAFWRGAYELAAELMNEGQTRSSDPLVWVAALHIACEKLQAQAGPLFRADFLRARAGLLSLMEEGIHFDVEQAPEALRAPRKGRAHTRGALGKGGSVIAAAARGRKGGAS